MPDTPLEVGVLVRFDIGVHRARAFRTVRHSQELLVAVGALVRKQIAAGVDIPQILMHSFVGCCKNRNSVHWKLAQQSPSLTVIFLLALHELQRTQHNNSKDLKNFRHSSTGSMLSQNLSDRSFSTGVNLYNTSEFEASRQSIECSGWMVNQLPKRCVTLY